MSILAVLALIVSGLVLAFDAWTYRIVRKARRECESILGEIKIINGKVNAGRMNQWKLENAIRVRLGQSPLPPPELDDPKSVLIREGDLCPKEDR